MHKERAITSADKYLISILMLSLFSISYSIRIIALRALLKFITVVIYTISLYLTMDQTKIENTQALLTGIQARVRFQ